MKIAFFDSTPDEEPTLRELLASHECSFIREPLTKENVGKAAECEALSVFVSSGVTRDIMSALPSLKCITTRSTGFDHIDLDAAKERGIVVCTVPSYGSRTVAEFAFGLMLSLSRKIFQARLRILEGGRFANNDLRGFDLYDKVLGVVGTGRIGKNVIKIAKAFGMKVIAHDKYPDEEFAREMEYEYVSLIDLLLHADVVTLHTPSTPETFHLINAKNIFNMKKGALLINTARGDLVETDALVRALASGHLGGAGIDVLEQERELREEAELLSPATQPADFKTLFQNRLLMDRPDVILTPHIAFNTDEAVHEILATTADNLNAFAAGMPKNAV